MYIFLALLDRRVAVRVGNLGLLAERGGDGAVDKSEHRDGAGGDGDGSAEQLLALLDETCR